MKAKRGAVHYLTKRPIVRQDGDHFGEMALLYDTPRNATIRTLTTCLFLTLPKTAFLALIQGLPAVRTAVDAHIERNRANRGGCRSNNSAKISFPCHSKL